MAACPAALGPAHGAERISRPSGPACALSQHRLRSRFTALPASRVTDPWQHGTGLYGDLVHRHVVGLLHPCLCRRICTVAVQALFFRSNVTAGGARAVRHPRAFRHAQRAPISAASPLASVCCTSSLVTDPIPAFICGGGGRSAPLRLIAAALPGPPIPAWPWCCLVMCLAYAQFVTPAAALALWSAQYRHADQSADRGGKAGDPASRRLPIAKPRQPCHRLPVVLAVPAAIAAQLLRLEPNRPACGGFSSTVSTWHWPRLPVAARRTGWLFARSASRRRRPIRRGRSNLDASALDATKSRGCAARRDAACRRPRREHCCGRP